MDGDMKRRMRQALKRGIKIKIIYGIEASNNESRYKQTEKVAKMLRGEFAKFGKLFEMKRNNTHGKLLICDSWYYIIGSFNFLSFTGDYTGDDVRNEIGEYSENKDMLEFYARKWFS